MLFAIHAIFEHLLPLFLFIHYLLKTKTLEYDFISRLFVVECEVIFRDSVIAPNIKQKELNDFVTLLIWAVTCEYEFCQALLGNLLRRSSHAA